ncbi:MAG: Tyrosine recombinase XerC [uncultured Sulfurovum sp.]|uniref:Tyrosine recombinase XerC n=1 Tax=uncultured Sulfurovum sp. TaxID=269237 RepID=A0A6S6TEV9_9BACT|nr:MAG: Tyrosine recombinase XerC [uncultured Sulfurovum sp.]
MVSLKEKFNNFLFYLEKVRGYAPTSIVTYENTLNELLSSSEYYEEDKKLVLDITPFRLKNVNNSKKTISKKLSAIRSFIKFMQEQQELEIKLIGDSPIKVPKTLPKPIDKLLIEEILDVSNSKEHLIISLLYGLGLRISELSSLKLTDINMAWIEVEGKGSKSRQIPLLESLYTEINNYKKKEHPKMFLFEKKGKQMSSSQIRYLFTKVFKKSGIKATPHQLRHSFASHLLNNGARISDVSELLGHSSMVSTQIYTQLSSNKKLNEYAKAHPLCQADSQKQGK